MKPENKEHVDCLETYILENTPERIHQRYSELASYAKTHDFGDLEQVVVLDTETTGFSFNHDELIQIAAARMEKGEIVDWYVTFVNPGIPIPDDIQYLTHITEEQVKDAPSPDEAVAKLAEFVGSSYVVAHNATFDRTFTTKYPAGESLKSNLWFDSLDLARIALPRFTSHRLLDLVRAFGGPESTHRADDDVAATCLVYRILLAGVALMPSDLVSYIADAATVGQWHTVEVFKKMALSQVAPYRLATSRRKIISNLYTPDQLDSDWAPWLEKNKEVPEEQLANLSFVSDETIAEAFDYEGAVGKSYTAYEPRNEQSEMALAVHKALVRSENLVVEAGTGVGKSMAYLVPLVQVAKENKVTVGVATKTNALLDQLMTKELPLLDKAFGVKYTSLKGFTHYPCLRKIQQIVEVGPRMVEVRKQEVHQAPALAALLSFIDQSDYDDIDGLKMDYRSIPRYRITTKSAECLRRKCPFFGKQCFVHGAREQALHCDVVVTNHSLLFWDLRVDGGLLPPVRHWVVDEAHGAEAEARRALSVEVSTDAIQKLIRRVSGDSQQANVFLRALRRIELTQEAQSLFESLCAKANSAGGAFAIAAQEFCLAAKDLLYFDSHAKGKSYEYIELWLNDEIRESSIFAGVLSAAQGLKDSLDNLIRAARDIVAYLESLEETSKEQRDIALVALELKELLESLATIFFTHTSNRVYSVSLSRQKNNLNDVFKAQPLDIGPTLNETLYQQTNSVIYTSATLSVNQTFDSFEQAMGLNESEESFARALHIDSSYDFDANMKVFVASDIPEPGHPDYLSALQDFLTQLHLAQNGSMLTLFTNRKEMEKCFDEVYPQLKAANLRLICQKWGVSLKGLRDDFLKDQHLSLFALKSFWEGFDAPGSTLRGVVIPRLPFGLPTDPLSCERKQHDAHAWNHYSLPSAVIEVKQAVGRLIRSAQDKGVVVLADSRLVTKHYGRTFLNSLPSKTVAILPMEDIVKAVQNEQTYG